MKFAQKKCEACGAKLTGKKPEDAERYGEPAIGEEPFPERYVAKCPSCGNYNLVEGTPELSEPETPAPEALTKLEPGEGSPGDEPPEE